MRDLTGRAPPVGATGCMHALLSMMGEQRPTTEQRSDWLNGLYILREFTTYVCLPVLVHAGEREREKERERERKRERERRKAVDDMLM